MSYVGNFPAGQPLSSADLLNDIITADKIAAGAVGSNQIASGAVVLDSADVTGVLPVSKGGTGSVNGVTSGATGGGTDKAFVQNDTEIASDWGIGNDRMVSGVSISIASPAVFTLANHNLVAGRQVRLSTTGTLPTGLASTNYYVISAGLTGNTFQLSSTMGGMAINTSGTQSGTHSVGRCANANSVGPMAILDGVTVTIPDGCSWSIAG